VIVMVAGVLVEVPPWIPVPIPLWSRLTWAAGLPEPVTPLNRNVPRTSLPLNRWSRYYW
jgi:hypothetical protein